MNYLINLEKSERSGNFFNYFKRAFGKKNVHVIIYKLLYGEF